MNDAVCNAILIGLAVARVGPAAKSGKFERRFDPGSAGLASGATERRESGRLEAGEEGEVVGEG
jgi:hypothetical protein